MEELASLLSVDTTTDDGRPIIKSKRIPVNDSQQMEWFLKEVRNKDKETNLVRNLNNFLEYRNNLGDSFIKSICCLQFNSQRNST